MMRAIAVSALVLTLCAESNGYANEANEAAEHVAKAEAAELNSDWTAALDHYSRAYAVSGNASLLFNIATDYERLGKLRDAAAILRRLEAETANESERRQARSKARRLRKTGADVSFKSAPDGLSVLVDGREIGTTPLTTKIGDGEHVAIAVFNGVRGQPRSFNVEFGEPVTIDFRIATTPGTLTVNTSVRNSQVRIDGVLKGDAPFTGPVAAGVHVVLVSAPGFQTASATIDVRAGEDNQVFARLTPIELATPGSGAGPRLGWQYLVGVAIGFSGDTDADTSGRGLLELGMRTRSRRFDLTGSFGSFGGKAGTGFGVAARMFFRGGTFRPYARFGLSFGRVENDDGEGTRSIAGEGGLGIRFVGKPTGRWRSALEYYVEINFQAASSDTEPRPSALIAPVAALSLSFPFTPGVTWRFGG